MIYLRVVELRDEQIYEITDLKGNPCWIAKGDLLLEYNCDKNCYQISQKQQYQWYSLNQQPIGEEILPVKSGDKLLIYYDDSRKTLEKRRMFVFIKPRERYIIGEILGKNSQNTKLTVKVLDLHLRSRAIMKLQCIETYKSIEQQRVQKFRRSALAHSRLTSPYIPQLRDVGEMEIHGNVYEYQVYEYFAGRTLEEFKKDGILQGEHCYGKAAKIFYQVALALQDMQNSGIAHRLLNESHILIDENGCVNIVGMSLLKDENQDALSLSGDLIGDVRLCPLSVRDPKQKDIYCMIVLFLYTVGGISLEKLKNPPIISEMCRNHLPEDLLILIDRILQKDFPSINEIVKTFEKAADYAAHNINRRQQYLLFPDSKDIEIPKVNISVWYQTLDELGGDFYDIIPISQQKTGLLIGDAMGHGLRASFFCHMIQPVARILSAQKVTEPNEILKTMNSLLHRSKGPMRMAAFATAQYALLSITDTSKYLLYSSAGHPHIILCRNGKAQLCCPEEVIFAGNKLGFCETQLFRVFEHCLELHTGDILVFYTDGIIELKNSEDVEYSQNRLLQLLSRTFVSADNVVTTVKQDLQRYSNKKYDDDITLMAVEICE